MQKNLAEVLLNKGLIIPGTLVYGLTTTSGLGQTLSRVPKELMIENFVNDIFYCRDRTGSKYVMYVDDVQEIDGMTPERFAAVYNIKPDGGKKAVGKKRGRKPKSAQINTAEGDLDGQDQRTENNYYTQ